MSFGQPDVACMTNIGAPNALRNRTFNACTSVVLLLEGCRGLELPTRLQCFMLCLVMQGHIARPGLGTSALLSDWTGSASCRCKTNVDDGNPSMIVSMRPFLTGVSLGTGHPLGIPVNDELPYGESLWGQCLPTMVLRHWTDNIHLVLLLTVNQ